jgi:hypothetical protein
MIKMALEDLCFKQATSFQAKFLLTILLESILQTWVNWEHLEKQNVLEQVSSPNS